MQKRHSLRVNIMTDTMSDAYKTAPLTLLPIVESDPLEN